MEKRKAAGKQSKSKQVFMEVNLCHCIKNTMKKPRKLGPNTSKKLEIIISSDLLTVTAAVVVPYIYHIHTSSQAFLDNPVGSLPFYFVLHM